MLAAVTALAAVAGCGGPASEPELVGTAERGGVRVEVRFAPNGDGGTVRATFAPQQQGFHVYSTALPAQGVDGVGRPTRLEVTGALSPAGPVTADRDAITLQVPGVDRPVPVYPDGPVTLRLAVARGAGGGTPTAVVGFAACSTRTCLPPVAGLRIPLAPS